MLSFTKARKTAKRDSTSFSTSDSFDGTYTTTEHKTELLQKAVPGKKISSID